MFWEAQATLVDRPRGIATLAAACSHHNVVLLELRTDQGEDGRFADAILLATPGGFTTEDVEHLFSDVDTYGTLTALPAEDRRFEATDQRSRTRRRHRPIHAAARRPGQSLSDPTGIKPQPPAGTPAGHLKRALASVALLLTTSRP